MRMIFLTVIAAIAVSGCVTETQKQKFYAAQRPATPAERAAILDYAKTFYFDPYSMRDVSLSDAVDPKKENTVAFCLRANAKNRMGAYTGLKTTALLMQNGKVTKAEEESFMCADPRMTYTPFRDLEDLT